MKVGTKVVHTKHGFEGVITEVSGINVYVKITKGVHPFEKEKDDYVALAMYLKVLEEPVFEVGDIITGTLESNKRYGMTTTAMKKGEVIEVNGNRIRVKIVEHVDEIYVGRNYDVDSKYFVKVLDDVDVDSNVEIEEETEIESVNEFDAEIEINGVIIRFDNVDDLIKFTKEMAVIKL